MNDERKHDGHSSEGGSIVGPLSARAADAARAAHAGQRYGLHPYTFHLELVADLGIRLAAIHDVAASDDVVAAVGWLHDIVEDTSVTTAQVAEQFGPQVATCVGLLTHHPGQPRREYLDAMAGNRLALVVKLADTHVNSDEGRLLELEKSDSLRAERLRRKYASQLATLQDHLARPSGTACEERDPG